MLSFVNTPINLQHGCSSFLRAFRLVLMSLFLLINISINVVAQEQQNQPENSDIAQEIELLKQEVIKLNRELYILEEDLLFPASTQVAVFVSVDIGRFLTLDSVELKINGKQVAGFLYTERQRISLEQGGIQRLYQGNLKTGEHELTAIFIGLDNEQRTVKRAVNYRFEKEDEAVMIELKLEDNNQKYQAEVVVDEWVL